METENKSSGIGFTTLLQLAFIILKLCKVIDWSWWWVLSPSWITTLVAILIITVCIIHDKYVDYKSVKKWKEGDHDAEGGKTV